MSTHPKHLRLKRGPLIVFAKDIFTKLIDPAFVEAGTENYPRDDDLVYGLSWDGELKAYPEKMVTWHHVINDRIGGRAIAVTTCGQCRSPIVFDGTLENTRLIFSPAAIDLTKANHVMYDQGTFSLWIQISGECIWGAFGGRKLEVFPCIYTTWKSWRQMHTSTLVLSTKTGFDYDYTKYRPHEKSWIATEPYEDFLWSNRVEMPEFLQLDDRLHPKEFILGVRTDQSIKAYAPSLLPRGSVVNDYVGNVPIVVFFDEASAAAAAYGRELGGRVLTFTRDPQGRIVDMETSSSWNIEGIAENGPLMWRSLPAVPYIRSFWYAWAATHPHTPLYRPS